MSVDQKILRAARFKKSQSYNDENFQLFWSSSNDFNLEVSNLRTRVAEHRKKWIYSFQASFSKRGCDVGKLISAQHSTMRNAHRINSNVFARQLLHQLNHYTPIYLSTKQIMCFKPNKTSLAVVHVNNAQEEDGSLTTYVNNWETYVEFCEVKGDLLEYFCVFEVEAETSWMYAKLLPIYIKDAIGGILRSLQRIEDEIVVVKEIDLEVTRETEEDRRRNDPCWNEDHLRLPKCSEKEKLIVYQMKQKFPNATDNECIRYLTAKNFELDVACKSYAEYLVWKESMKKYKLADFKQILQKKMFTYLGKDKKGRPVVFNKAAAVVPDQLDQDLYVIFYSYFFEIYIASKMEGYVDQIFVIADGQGLGTKNFKISLTKKNLDGLLRYSPQRQSKLIAVHANWFGLGIWTILKPMLPKKTLDKINVFGYDDKKILEALKEEMDMDVIPECLGGRNNRLWQDCFV